MHKLSFLRGGGHFGDIAGALVLALSTAFAAMTPRADAALLVNDGFPVGEGGYATAEGTALNAQTITDSSVKGFAWSKWNDGGGTGAIYSLGDDSGLLFPSSFALHGISETGDASAGMHAGSGPGNPRCAEKLFSMTDWPVSGNVYLRFLIWIDSKGVAATSEPKADTLFTGTTCYAAGISSVWNSKSDQYAYFFSSASNVLFGVAKNLEGDDELDLCVIGSDNAKTICTLVPPDDFKADTTYLCLAEIGIDAGTGGKERIRAVAIPTDDWKPNFKWTKLDDDDTIESEIWSGNAHAAYFGMAGRYQNQNGYFKVDEIAIGTALTDVVYYDPSYPEISDCFVVHAANGFEVSATSACSAPVALVALVDDGTLVSEQEITPSLQPGESQSLILQNLAANTTYSIAVAAENASGAVTNYVGSIYNGMLSIAQTANADESGFVAGGFSVSRTDSSFDLVVNYTCSGTAVNGVNYETLSETVVIPAGSTAATVDVKPFIGRPHDAATQLDITLAAGNYIVSEPAPSASVIIANLAPPSGTNTWVAAADGDASVAANWSFGRVPESGDDILLDGTFSTANLTWDGATEGMTDTVKSWTQLVNYTGVVTMDQTRTGTFTSFTVTEDAVLSGGSWTHTRNPGKTSTASVWLDVSVKGKLKTGERFAFNVDEKGFSKNSGPATSGEKGGSTHGGQGGPGNASTEPYGRSICYGDAFHPVTFGSGGYYDGDVGGGSVHLTVAGDFKHDGVVTSSGNNSHYVGLAGGSIWISAKSLSGSGVIRANGGGADASHNRGGGGGGRVAIYLTDQSSTYVSFTNGFSGIVSACGGRGLRTGDPQHPGSAGTVYIETAGDSGVGRMIIRNNAQSLSAVTKWTLNGTAQVVDGVTWNLAELSMKEHGRVGIKSGGTLHVPSFAKITGDGTAQSLLRFEDGGTLESDIKHDKLVAEGFGIENYGTSSLAAHELVIPDDSSLKVSGDFTVGNLKINGVRIAAGDYFAATLAETYDNVSGDGTIHVQGLANALTIIVR